MMKLTNSSFGFFIPSIFLLLMIGCSNPPQDCSDVVEPVTVTDTVKWDTDDPAIWINQNDVSQSLILGTDKDEDGALYVFDLDGNVIEEKTIRNINRPNNVDVEYGFMMNGKEIDIAVLTERYDNKLRVFSLPDMKAIDNGGIQAEGLVAPMGISLYKRPSDGAIFAIVSPKEGSTENYLWQFLLKDDGNGNIIGEVVRRFGNFSGIKEVEAIAVDDQLGYVYYSDEQFGVRKYNADPSAPDADKELGIIDTKDYWEDNEGICIYPTGEGTGYILVSDQSANRFRIYLREGTPAIVDPEDPEDNEPAKPHQHKLVKIVNTMTNNSDGSEATNVNLGPKFPNGMFVAMSDDKTFQIYSWDDIIGKNVLSTENYGL
ncbi:MAG: phytase [Melioribacteraceae bacterium]|nr:phytase [Melioribacteraceae bacterium]